MKRGVHAMLYAFFDEEERLHRASMRRQVELCLKADVAGIAALGLATEVSKLSFEERRDVMSWVAEDVNGTVPLGFTIYGQSVAEQVSMVRHAEQVGADWLILQPPAVGTFDAAEYLSFFGRVMKATALPVAIQNAPQYLGRGLSNEDIEILRQRHGNFTVIKSESSAVEAEQLIKLAGREFKVFNGRGGLELIACLKAGCEGFLLAPDLADYSAEVMRLFEVGAHDEAQRLYDRTSPIIQLVMGSIEHLICYGKRLFALRAGLQVFDRAPALRPEAHVMSRLEELSAGLGAFPLRQAG
jgi:4-hydroxy-tetrahydrodipicolinate synthase